MHGNAGNNKVIIYGEGHDWEMHFHSLVVICLLMHGKKVLCSLTAPKSNSLF